MEKGENFMFRIKIKGVYQSESDLTKGKPLLEGAVMFNEGKSLQDAFLKGFLVGLPLILSMILLTILKCRTIDYTIRINGKTGVFFVVMLAVLFLLTYVHELIHALFYPKDAVKTIWKAPMQGAYFVYCDAPVKKSRFILLCAAPAVLLGIVPFIAWYLLADFIPMPYSLAMVFTAWLMTVMSIGDYANIYNTVRQVPKGAKVFQYGMHSYWIKEQK